MRIGAALAFAATKISERLTAGDTVRDDGFFEFADDERPAGDEIAEAVVLAAQRESVGNGKCALYGNLLAAVTFDESISRGEAERASTDCTAT